MALISSDTYTPTTSVESTSALTTSTGATEPEQGVIEEARRRQRRRYLRTVIGGLIGAALVGALVWALIGGSSRASSGGATGEAGHPGAVDASDAHALAFNVRVVPMLVVGQAGWCLVNEENGITGTSSCGGVPTPSSPFLQVDGWGVGGSHHETQVAVTDPQVVAILIDGTRRVATVPLPGLPYGLRGARVVTPAGGSTIVGLGAQGQRMPEHWTNTPRQASVRSWRYPGGPLRGPCELRASKLPGLSPRAGQVATKVNAFPGQLVGRAFLPCVSTTYYLHGLPVKATIALDAASPHTRAAALPDFHPVLRSPGFYFEGGLTARRAGNAWLIVGQGSGLAERMRVIRHLVARVSL